MITFAAMEVGFYIYKLLMQHDCVVLPDFGGLVTNYTSASIHPSQHLFQPPSKAIAFNSSLKTNDGLLAKAISEAEHISYDDALQRVKSFVRKVEESLTGKGSFKLDGVGNLFYDIEKKLQFKQEEGSNFLLSSYGLEHFISQPVLRPENLQHIEHQLPNKKQPKQKRRTAWLIWIIVLLLALAAAIQVLSMQGLLPKIDLKEIGLSIAPNVNSSVSSIPTHSKDTVVHIIVYQNKPEQVKHDTVFISSNTANIQLPQPTTEELSAYYVVMGCYKDSISSVPFSNACNLRGIPVEHLNCNHKYYRIGISGFSTMNAAINSMHALTDSTGYSAWVMKAD